LWTSDTNREFQIWDLGNLDDEDPYAELNMEQSATGGFDCEGNVIYTAQTSNKALQIIGPGSYTPEISFYIHNDSHDEISTANIGDIIHSKTILSGDAGTPTGEINITFYNNNDCSGTGMVDSSNPFSIDESGIVEPTSSWGPLDAGDYSLKASYGGDYDYDSIDSECKSLSIDKLDPSSITNVVIPGTTVSSGTVIHDEATVVGNGTVPITGNVTFNLYKNNSCNGGSGQILQTSTGTVTNGVALSANFTTTSSNKNLSYGAVYTGDINYNSITASCKAIKVN
jgi:hypothetical protein